LIIGYPTENLAPFVEENGLSDSCYLTGRVEFEKLPQYLQLADIAIDPKCSSAGEGSGKMLNYLAAGLPVVAFKSQNNADFLPAGSDLANSPQEMVSILAKLSDDAELRAKIAQQNFAHFEESFSWAVTKGQLEKVYTQLVSLKQS